MKRVVTALCLVPIAVYSVLFAPWWILFAVIAIVAVLCFREYSAITESFAPLGYVAGILILAAPQHETVLLMILSALAALCLMLSADDPAKGFAQTSALVYILDWCGNLCSQAVWVYLEKQNGVWTLQSGKAPPQT